VCHCHYRVREHVETLDNGTSIFIERDSDWIESPYDNGDYMRMSALIRTRGSYDTYDSCDESMPIRSDIVLCALREHDSQVVVRWLRIFYSLTVVEKGGDIYYSREPERDVLAEISLLDAWRCGDTGGWVVEDRAGEEIDSCWGFYLSDSERAYMITQAREAAEKGADE